MKYSTIKKVKNVIEPKVIDYNSLKIKVKQFLSSSDIYDLIEITMQDCLEDGIYNAYKINIFYHVNLVMMYTDITFEDGETLDKFALYDDLKSCGLMDKIIGAIPSAQYTSIMEHLSYCISDKHQYGNNLGSVIKAMIEDLPAKAEAAAKIVQEFDPEQYQKVIDFATAANGGRPITAPIAPLA